MPNVYTIPKRYTARSIVGITSGRELPTIYFNDGAHFTQCHGKGWNIGYHKPTRHLFFGNVPNTIADREYDRAWRHVTSDPTCANPEDDVMDEFYICLAQALHVDLNAAGGIQLVAPMNQQPQSSLFEVTVDADGVAFHISGGFVYDIPIAQKYKIMLELEQNMAIKEKNVATNNWSFKKKPRHPNYDRAAA